MGKGTGVGVGVGVEGGEVLVAETGREGIGEEEGDDEIAVTGGAAEGAEGGRFVEEEEEESEGGEEAASFHPSAAGAAKGSISPSKSSSLSSSTILRSTLERRETEGDGEGEEIGSVLCDLDFFAFFVTAAAAAAAAGGGAMTGCLTRDVDLFRAVVADPGRLRLSSFLIFVFVVPVAAAAVVMETGEAFILSERTKRIFFARVTQGAIG
jgi:hypothetical protein